jgi:hypothetical protein
MIDFSSLSILLPSNDGYTGQGFVTSVISSLCLEFLLLRFALRVTPVLVMVLWEEGLRGGSGLFDCTWLSIGLETARNINEVSKCSGRDSKRVSLEYRSEWSLLHRLVL